MNDAPFDPPHVDPDNPVGAWHLPVEDFDAPLQGQLDVRSTFDGCAFLYSAAQSPFGALAIVRFQFTNSFTGQLLPVDFIGSADVVTRLGSGISVAASRAAAASRKLR